MGYYFVNKQEDFKSLCGSLVNHSYISIDTESNSLHAYHEQLCLLQLSSETINAVIDMLAVDMTPLLPLFANSKIEKIFHSADSDIRVLKSAVPECRLENIFDTMLAAKKIGIERCGLDHLVKKYIGIELDKHYQKADWGKRPLSQAMLDYAAGDTKYLKTLRDILIKEVEEKGLTQQYQEQMKAVCEVEPHKFKFNEDHYLSFKGARFLNCRGLSVLKQLFLAREKAAMKKNIPPFKIIAEDFMVRIAAAPENAMDNISNFKGATRFFMENHAEWVLKAIEEGLSSPVKNKTAKDETRERRKKTETAAKRYKALKQWRKKLATKKKLFPSAIIPDAMLEKLAFALPHTKEELLKINGLEQYNPDSFSSSLIKFMCDYDAAHNLTKKKLK